MWKTLIRFLWPEKTSKSKPSSQKKTVPTREKSVQSEREKNLVIDLDIDEAFIKLILGVHSFLDVKPNLIEKRALERIDQLLISDVFDDRALPRLPAVVPQLLASLRSDDASGKNLADQISRDPVLVGEVIRLANSAFYQTGTKINSLQRAVILLGRTGLQRLIANVVMKPIFNIHEGHFGHLAANYLWSQSERCAHACAYLARGRFDAFDAYLAGIVCNIGMIVAIRIMDHLQKSRELPQSIVFYQEFLIKTKQLTFRIAENWQFPSAVLDALKEQTTLDQKPDIEKLGSALYTANRLSQLRVLVDEKNLEDDIDQLNHRLGGQLTESCIRCYFELKRLSELHA
ncbi:MAG: HDOD domain-containing protein [Gammaproteobacteria bacterium]|nr:HDOD domain-containing protein [Gammaproteobacteria bacterium]